MICLSRAGRCVRVVSAFQRWKSKMSEDEGGGRAKREGDEARECLGSFK